MKRTIARLGVLFLLAGLLPTLGLAAGISDDPYDFQVLIDGVVFQFPTDTQALTDAGWVLDMEEEAGEAMMEGSAYVQLELVRADIDDSAVLDGVFLLNLSLDAQPMLDADVAGLTYCHTAYEGKRRPELVFARGIVPGVSTSADILAAYGTPTAQSEGTSGVTLDYELSKYQGYDFYLVDDLLTEVTVKNFVASGEAGQRAGSAEAGELPGYPLDYAAPGELGEATDSGVFQFEGDLYRLPFPVRALEDNGWEIAREDADLVPSVHTATRAITLKRGTSPWRCSG